ncbi:MAG: replicative DNA helicase [Planctomycetales bacterium]|nr:replicative DNA helicase [Planctomycetales bacterium]NIM09012.1 replicative DNA helicase [Planctomycetales bacterium]NIN08475.1 replicative DNA helicase [Planctomycetales bacterium]NIN77609.1 replicative DNA helicase [Planctomycetales bacterium]NIO34774.1 replicative DNA helicase [Planctomycetales bacterium]
MATAQGTERTASGGGRQLLDRQPPCNLEAERNTLGSMILLPEVCDEVSLILQAEDFYDQAHRTLYQHITELYEKGQKVDLTLLIDRLKSTGDFEEIGGAAALAEIAHSVPTAANAAYYARIIHEKSILRSLIYTSTEIVQEAYQQEHPARELLNQAEEKIFGIRDQRGKSGDLANIHDVLMEAFEQIDARMEHGGASGLSTGFRDVDKLTGGLHPEELIIVAARPSMGKTAFAANIAEHVAVEENQPTLFVSLEMSRFELAQRMMCSLGEINGEKFRSGFLSGADHKKLIEVSATLGKSPLFIDDTPTRTVTEIIATARRLKRRHGSLGLVVIDYLQLIQPDNPADPRQEQVAKMARRLKAMARELAVPVLCLAQLNRQAEMTRDNRPKLSHLRESGAIEQDADVVIMIHREEYYLSPQERESMRSGANPHSCLGEADVIIAKQRNGPTGDVKLHWFQQFTRFKNAATHAHEEFEAYADQREF